MEITTDAQAQRQVKLLGNWSLRYLLTLPELTAQLTKLADDNQIAWDLRALQRLDNTGALMLWQAWGRKFPSKLSVNPTEQQLLEHWQQQVIAPKPVILPKSQRIYAALQKMGLDIALQLQAFIALLGQLLLDVKHLCQKPEDIPWAEISISIHQTGVRALGITALVGFLIGIVLSYLSALQLKMLGAEIYIIDILGLSIIRELGPLLAAILVAGRSGSAMTAQIGIMRVTEELDALSAMGISHSLRLVLPRVLALSLVLPLLSVWTSALALLGGMYAAQTMLDISYQQFFLKIPEVVPLTNLFIGLVKSAVFGLGIALIACYFGFKIQPNTESLGNETTNSVVVAITAVIMIDALFAIVFMGIGMP